MKIDKTVLGFVGALLLILGTLVPIISLPIVGSQNYFQNGQGDGVFVIILAVVAIILVLTKNFKFLVLTGLLSAGVISFTLITLLTKLAQIKAQMEASLEGNPFAGIATGLMGSVQIQWGWFILYLGAAAVVASGILNSRESKVSSSNPIDSHVNDNPSI